jgi:dihydrofolate synthase/folylpolyglutamate synthase
MNYQQALDFLFNLERFGIKLGLENTLSLMQRLDNPHLKFPSIHVAGSNGKGSCSAMLHSILHQAGYLAGLYTSPHLVDFNERIKVGDCPIEKEFVVDFISELKDEIVKKGYTFFEVATAIAFYYFAFKNVEIAVVETGLGGRLDSTNILNPEVAIITKISLEHTEILGKNLEKIAGEKGGIIKENIPTVTSERKERPFKVIGSLCRKKNSELISVFKDSSWEIKTSSLNGIKFDLRTQNDYYNGVKLNLAGEHQIANAACAVLALENLNHKFTRLGKDSIMAGLNEVKWRGRLELYKEKPIVILDVAHNPDGIRSLVNALRGFFPHRKVNFIFGVMEDKDYRKMLQILERLAKEIILVQVQYQRSAKLESLVKTAQELGLKFQAVPDVDKAYEYALRIMDEEEVLCVTGSHFAVGEFLNNERRKDNTS